MERFVFKWQIGQLNYYVNEVIYEPLSQNFIYFVCIENLIFIL